MRKFLSPIFAAAGVGAIGLLAVCSQTPWLFASLGPTIAMQCMDPGKAAVRPWNIAAGHSIGVFSGFISVWMTGALNAPLFSTEIRW
jgi:hypothetical protein